MPEPLTLIAAGAAVGGAAGKFVEKAWDSGEKWLANYLENHKEKAQDKAKENAGIFLGKLGVELKKNEDSKLVSKDTIEDALNHPDFSDLLQKSLISAALTDNDNKQSILAKIVSERLQTESESLLAITCKSACEIVPNLTENQLLLLGMLATVYHLEPKTPMSEDEYDKWLNEQLKNYMGISVKHLDMLHIDTYKCGKYETFISRDLNKMLSAKNKGVFNYDKFSGGEVGDKVISMWKDESLFKLSLTTIGQLIGFIVSNQQTGSAIDLSGWQF